MTNMLSVLTLAKESMVRLLEYIPTNLLDTYGSTRLQEINDVMRKTSSKVIDVTHYLASHPIDSLEDILKLLSRDDRKISLTAATDRLEIYWHNDILRIKWNQSDIIPPVSIHSIEKYREAMLLIASVYLVHCIIFVLRFLGYPVASLKKIKETVLKVYDFIQKDETFSLVSRRLKNGATDQKTFRLIYDLVSRLYKKGLIQEIVKDLLEAGTQSHVLSAIGGVTVLIVVVNHLVDDENFRRLFKGTLLLSKIPVMWQLGEKYKSKL